jgi:hypothetical protein
MYTMTPPDGAWGDGHETVEVPVQEGLVIMDAVKRQIAEIEILYRNEIRAKLLLLLP